jgi:hypothetical protein
VNRKINTWLKSKTLLTLHPRFPEADWHKRWRCSNIIVLQASEGPRKDMVFAKSAWKSKRAGSVVLLNFIVHTLCGKKVESILNKYF